MKAIREKIGNTEVLVELSEEKVIIEGETQDGPAIMETGIDSNKLKDAYSKAKSVIKEMASDMSNHFKDLASENTKNMRPKNLEMEFNMALSAQTGAWMLKGKGECVFKIKNGTEISKK